jgi:protein-disulfide isomerase
MNGRLQEFSVPIAIVFAGALIAVSLYFVAGGGTHTSGATTLSVNNVVPVTSEDHIIGNPSADIMIIEYSDLDCPYCKQFQATMKQIITLYGPSGKVAWVYRNFPLKDLHPNAPQLAEAAECVASIGGNDAYWKFIDELFAAAPGSQMTDMSRVGEFAAKAGVQSTAFNDCYGSAKFQSKIAQEFKDATNSGGQGTPHTIIVSKSGKVVPIEGAQAYATVKSVIDAMLASN